MIVIHGIIYSIFIANCRTEPFSFNPQFRLTSKQQIYSNQKWEKNGLSRRARVDIYLYIVLTFPMTFQFTWKEKHASSFNGSLFTSNCDTISFWLGAIIIWFVCTMPTEKLADWYFHFHSWNCSSHETLYDLYIHTYCPIISKEKQPYTHSHIRLSIYTINVGLRECFQSEWIFYDHKIVVHLCNQKNNKQMKMTKQKSIAVWLGRGKKFIGFELMQHEKFLNELLKHIRYNHIFVWHIARSPHRRMYSGQMETFPRRHVVFVYLFLCLHTCFSNIVII